MIDILFVSHACLTAINRRPYRNLANRGWRVEIVTAVRYQTANLTKEADPPEANDPPLHLLELRGRSSRFWRFEGLLRVLEQRRPRVVLLDYTPGSVLALEVGAWARLRGAHLVCLSVDNLGWSLRSGIARDGAKGALRILMARAMSLPALGLVDHVFALSDAGVADLQTIGFGDRTSKTPLGFDPEAFVPNLIAREQTRAALGLRETTVAYFGRHMREKGIHVLLEALAKLRHQRWQLLIDRFDAYKHTYAKSLNDQIDASGLRERTVFFDATHDEMPAYINAADIVVVPSLETPGFKEQYGRVVPEAMACGRAVMVSQSGALPELLGDAGIRFPPDDSGALAMELSRLLEDEPRRRALGERARVRAHSVLSMTTQVDLIEALVRRWTSPSGATRVA